MPSKKWKCLEIHAKSFEGRNDLIRDIVLLMRRLKQETHVESYFFNRYSDTSKNVFFIKFGSVNSDEKAQFELDELLKKHSAIKNMKPYTCEMWDADDVPIDAIKCISCELHEKIIDNFGKKPTIKQAYFLLHFLMNQLGFSYEEEHQLYNALKIEIGKKLGK